MKKVLLLTMAALSILFTQCKKTEVAPSTPSAQGGVNITLNVDGSKVGVNPETGAVTFENGDKIYVANGGKYVGTLTHNGAQFTGTIYNPQTTDEPLYFYFLGNKTPSGSLSAGETSSLTVDLSDQTASLPVISCAPSNQNYSPSISSYTATLHNKCALVKFTLDQAVTTGYVAVKNMNNVVAVDLSAGTLTPSMGNKVTKINKKDNTHCYMIVLEQDEIVSADGDLFCEDGHYGNFGTLQAVIPGVYMSKDVTLQQGPVFTVASGKTVTFSPGFMYWDGNEDAFKFETSQTAYSLGDYHSETGKYDWNPNHVNHFFWSKTASVAYAATYSDASASVSDVFFTNNQSDQAKPNSGFTVNGETGIWRTLSSAEWVYLLNVSGSEGRTGNRFAKAMVNSKQGLLIFPDGYSGTTSGDGIATVNSATSKFPVSSIQDATWSTMQLAGVVFLPATGGRTGESISVGLGRCYSSSSLPTDVTYALRMDFDDSNVHSQSYYGGRITGYCIRLVR